MPTLNKLGGAFSAALPLPDKEGFSIKKETHNKLSKKIKDVIDRAAKKNNVYIWDPSKINNPGDAPNPKLI